MKRMYYVMLLAFALTSCDVMKTVAQPGAGLLTEAEAGSGIKEALGQGLVKAVLQLNKQDGFFGDAFYKILLPPDALKAERALRNIGMGSMLDKAILAINRGAEDAVGKATPIFTDAIKSMTLTDALNLVKGGDTSATHFFRTKTTAQLAAAFAPVIKTSLDKTEATKYYSDVIKAYNGLPTTFRKINPDLQGFVTEKATNALFDQVAKEEKNIRQNPLARGTDLLKKVFGGIKL
ncbi:MAG: DUF4197 domain-containing protein [Ferruginibacter sp.]